MKWIARVFVFTAALGLGASAASLLGFSRSSAVDNTAVWHDHAVVPIDAEKLSGIWAGQWGYNQGDCTIEISRVEGTAFYGTLRKEGAEILFEGTFDPATREVYFEETEVLRLGATMSEWSLGINRGTISRDARVIFGTGHDKWGQYAWAVSGN